MNTKVSSKLPKKQESSLNSLIQVRPQQSIKLKKLSGRAGLRKGSLQIKAGSSNQSSRNKQKTPKKRKFNWTALPGFNKSGKGGQKSKIFHNNKFEAKVGFNAQYMQLQGNRGEDGGWARPGRLSRLSQASYTVQNGRKMSKETNPRNQDPKKHQKNGKLSNQAAQGLNTTHQEASEVTHKVRTKKRKPFMSRSQSNFNRAKPSFLYSGNKHIRKATVTQTGQGRHSRHKKTATLVDQYSKEKTENTTYLAKKWYAGPAGAIQDFNSYPKPFTASGASKNGMILKNSKSEKKIKKSKKNEKSVEIEFSIEQLLRDLDTLKVRINSTLSEYVTRLELSSDLETNLKSTASLCREFRRFYKNPGTEIDHKTVLTSIRNKEKAFLSIIHTLIGPNGKSLKNRLFGPNPVNEASARKRRRQMEGSVTSKEEKMNNENVEYSKLKKEHFRLKSKLEELGELNKANEELRELLADKDVLIEDFRQQISTKSTRNMTDAYRMRAVLNVMQGRIEEANAARAELESRVAAFQDTQSRVETLLANLNAKIAQYREISLMQVEEISEYKGREAELNNSLRDLHRRLIIKRIDQREYMKKETLDIFKVAEEDYRNKIEHLLKEDFVYIKNTIIDDFRSFEKDQNDLTETYLQHASQTFHEEKNALRSDKEAYAENVRLVNDRVSTFEKDEGGFLANIDLSNLRFYRPSLFKVLKYRVDKMKDKEVSHIINKEFSLIGMIRVVRAILDSKWNEFMFYSDKKRFSKFSDFVYSWFSLFSVDVNSMKIIEIQSISQKKADLNRIRLLLQLRSSLFGKHWECFTFRDFLDGKYSMDEIYFYLYCRNSIHQGSLMASGDGYFRVIDYGDWKRVSHFLDKILKNFRRADIHAIKQKLKKACVMIRQYQHIDIAFVLRILLETYRTEKRLKYDYLKTYIHSEVAERFGTITKDYLSNFEDFRNFFNSNFLEMNELDIIEVYSDCYNIGRGQINFDTLYLVMQEGGYLIDDLRLRHLNLKNKFGIGNKNNKLVYHYMARMINLEIRTTDRIKRYSDNLGVQALNRKMNFWHAIIENHKKDIDWRDLIIGFTQLLAQRVITTGIILANLSEHPAVIERFLQKAQKSYVHLFDCVEDKARLDKGQQMRRSKAAVRIQRWITNKLSNWYKLMRVIMDLQVKNKDLKELEKADEETISEFNSPAKHFGVKYSR